MSSAMSEQIQKPTFERERERGEENSYHAEFVDLHSDFCSAGVINGYIFSFLYYLFI